MNEKALPQPQYLWFLMLCYSMVIVLANWFDVRFIQLFSLVTDAGTLIFPLTFLLSDLITEVYGYQQARRAIWCGFLFNVVFILYSQIIIHLPSPDFAVTSNQHIDAMLAFNTRIIFASMISYFVAEPLNAYLLAKMKIRWQGHQLALRFVASTLIASGLDSLIFCSIAFSGLMTNTELVQLILTMWLIKVAIEAIGLPLSVYLAKWLKQQEKLDIYDRHTDFSLFSLRVNYTSKDNQT